MSWLRAEDPTCETVEEQHSPIEIVIVPRARDIGGFEVRRALPGEVERWSLTSLREKIVKIGAKVIAHARYTVFQMAEVAVPRDLFRRILLMIDDLLVDDRRPATKRGGAMLIAAVAATIQIADGRSAPAVLHIRRNRSQRTPVIRKPSPIQPADVAPALLQGQDPCHPAPKRGWIVWLSGEYRIRGETPWPTRIRGPVSVGRWRSR